MKLDELLGISSHYVFSGLKKEHYRILKILAKHGTLNQKEMGYYASHNYTESPIHRWAVKKLLEGSYSFLGLIPNEFVYVIDKNKKEKHYGLTVKGILAVLKDIKFEDIFAVKEYRKFLYKYNKKTRIKDWAFELIKLEITLILYYNYARGLDLTRFKKIRMYLNRFKQYDHEIIQTFFVDTAFMNKKNRKVYDSIQTNYLILFFMLDKLTFPIEWGRSRNWYEDPLDNEGGFRKFIDRWYQYIDMYKISDLHVRKDSKRDDLLSYYDEELWYEEIKEPRKLAYHILKKYKYI